jgi:hypothetical protein
MRERLDDSMREPSVAFVLANVGQAGCECGLPFEHVLVGTPCGDFHAFHRKVEEMSEQPHSDVLERRDLRAYHKKIADFLIQAVNTEGCRYRITRNNIILYPPDGSAAVTVYARSSDRQFRSLVQWRAKHVVASVTDEAEAESPAEHLSVVPSPDVTDEPDETQMPLLEVDPALLVGEWDQHYGDDGEPVTGIETNGQLWRCALCWGTDQQYIANHPRGIAGHRRIRHSEHDFYTTEIIARRVDGLRFNRLTRQIEEAVTVLATTIGWEVGPKVNERITELEAEVATMRTRAEEAEAKLALVRESMGL